MGVVAEGARRLLVVGGGLLSAKGQHEVTHGIERKQVGRGRIRGEEREGCGNHGHGSSGRKGRTALAVQERGVGPPSAAPQHGGQREGGNIDHHHPHDGGQQLRQQFAHLARVGGDEVEPHVDGDGAAPIKIDEHHLEGAQEQQGEQQDDRSPHLAREGQHEPVGGQRRHNAHQAPDPRQRLGEGQYEVGQDEHQEEEQIGCLFMTNGFDGERWANGLRTPH